MGGRSKAAMSMMLGALELGLACTPRPDPDDSDSIAASETSEPGDGDGDGGDGDGDGDGGDGDGDGDDEGCGSVRSPAVYVPPQVMFVVEASTSTIASTWDHDVDPLTPQVTRWSSIYAVIAASTAAFDAAIEAGIQRFPTQEACPDATVDAPNCNDVSACTTALEPEAPLAPQNGAAILASIPGPDADYLEVAGATPIGRAFDSTLTHLLAQPSAPTRAILLITDGAANCNEQLPFPELLESYDQTLAAKLAAAYRDHGISTVVVGIDIVDALVGVGPDGEPEANPHARLNELALAGGAAEAFYNTKNESELIVTVAGVLDELASCVIDLTTFENGPPPPEQIPYVFIEADGLDVPYSVECESADGWTWIDEGLTLALCGSYCDAFREGSATYDIYYGCPAPW